MLREPDLNLLAADICRHDMGPTGRMPAQSATCPINQYSFFRHFRARRPLQRTAIERNGGAMAKPLTRVDLRDVAYTGIAAGLI